MSFEFTEDAKLILVIVLQIWSARNCSNVENTNPLFFHETFACYQAEETNTKKHTWVIIVQHTSDLLHS